MPISACFSASSVSPPTLPPEIGRTSLQGSVEGARARFARLVTILPDNEDVLSAAMVSALLLDFEPGEDGEAGKSCELTLALLDWAPNPFSRNTFTPGHVTCTGVVLSPSRDAVLLVHHRRLNRWLLPGGHVEVEDEVASDTARREVLEETGADLLELAPRLVGCDVHLIPSRGREPLHLHHDLIFAFQARSLRSGCSPESRRVVWRSVGQLQDLPGSIQRSVKRTLGS